MSEEDESGTPLVERISANPPVLPERTATGARRTPRVDLNLNSPEAPHTEELVAARLPFVSLLKTAEERYGEKGRAFFQARSEGCNVKEAAKRAGISRKTGHIYIRELRRSHEKS